MAETMDTQHALQAVERLQAKLKERGDVPTEEKLSLLKTVLQSPLFHQILSLQTSVHHLDDQGSTLPRSGCCAERASPAASPEPHALPHTTSCVLSQHNSVPGSPQSSPVASAPPRKRVEPVPAAEFEYRLRALAQGRYVTNINLLKPVSGGLGFSVVGLRSEDSGELGIFVQDIQPGDATNGEEQLKEDDQILSINGRLLEWTVTQQQAISLLQEGAPNIQLLVARGPVPELASPVVSRTPSAASTVSARSSASHWQRVETIELLNDGAGLGFGILGAKDTGILVKTILPGGIADQDGRLRCGDHILRIGETDLTGMGSEQVAQVLRLCGNRVKLIITRGPPDDAPVASLVLPPVAEQQETPDTLGCDDEEVEIIDVELTKNAQGLGITIAGYVAENNSEPSGIFVKSITKDSTVEEDGRIHVGDQIIAVDQTHIQGCSNQQAMEVLRLTGQTVNLTLLRRGSRAPGMPLPSAPVVPEFQPSPEVSKDDTADWENLDMTLVFPVEEEPCPSSPGRISPSSVEGDQTGLVDGAKQTASEEDELKKKWKATPDPGSEDFLAQVEKPSVSSGVGVCSQVMAGLHYVCPVLPEGPVGRAGKPSGGDELLEGEPDDRVVSSETNDSEEADAPAGILASPLPMWETKIQDIELEKGAAGLGFSILDYQDPMDPVKTVIVIRSLVPEGVAERDGRLLPGDRLMYVNGSRLENASLEDAVQALKGAPWGTVRMGVAKPLPMDSNETDLINEKMFDLPYSREEDTLKAPTLALRGSPRSVDLDYQMSMQSSTPKEEELCMETDSMEGTDKPISTSASNLERTITVVRGNSSLGMTVSALKDGSGMVIRSIVQGGSIGQDGRLGVGDSILAINGEPTTNVTNAQARALLRKHSLYEPDISITYVPAEHLEDYRATLRPLKEGSVTCTAPPAPRGDVLEPPQREDGAGEESELLSATHSSWNQPRKVELCREPGRSLGISIVGGRGMGSRLHTGEVMRGIFIKHILEDCPAGRDGTLKTGDRILEVGGVDLRDASHEQAAEAIRKAGDPVVFLVQSVVHGPPSPAAHPREVKVPAALASKHGAGTESHCRPFLRLSPINPFTPTPFKPPAPRDTGKFSLVTLSALRLPVMPHVGETDSDLLTEVPDKPPLSLESTVDKDDTAGNSWKKVIQRYGSLPGVLHMIELEKGKTGLGIRLAGNKDRSRMSVFVVEIDPCGAAGKDGRILVGDELLEINGQILYGRSHQNASSIIKSAPSTVQIIFIRTTEALSQMALGPEKEYRDMLNSQAEKDMHAVISPSGVDVHMFKYAHDAINPKDEGGWGTSISEEDNRSGAVIRSLTDHNAEARGGRMTAGDTILTAGDEIVVGHPVEKVNSLLKKDQSSEKLTICPDITGTFPAAVSPVRRASGGKGTGAVCVPLVSLQPLDVEPAKGFSRPSTPVAMAPDPLTCPIIPGCETTIDISKGHTGLGLSIVGGCDTLLEGIIIHQVYGEGAAAKDRRLWAGDQILEVNGIDLRAVTHDEAIDVLRQTPLDVRLMVFRDDAQFKEDAWEILSADLLKEPSGDMGIGIVGNRDSPGVFVSATTTRGAVETNSGLRPGDRILSVNGEDVRSATRECVAALLKRCAGPVNLQVARFKLQQLHSEGKLSLCSQTGNPGNFEETPHSLPEDKNFLGEFYKRRKSEESPDPSLEIRTITLTKGPASRDSPRIRGAGGDVPVFDASVDPAGLAAETQMLEIGDRVISIDGTSAERMTHTDNVSQLQDASDTVRPQVVEGGGPGDHNHLRVQTADEPALPDLAEGSEFLEDGRNPQYKTISLDRGTGGLGFSIVGGFGSPHGDLPIYVKTVFSKVKKGAAFEDGRLKRGDQIVAVDGQSLEGVAHAEAVGILKRSKGTVTLTVLS